jgi:hypothetical protein
MIPHADRTTKPAENRQTPEDRRTRRSYKVEAWALPSPDCRDQTQRFELHPAQVVAALSQEEAASIYTANYGIPSGLVAPRSPKLGGPLCILRVSQVRGGK